MRQYNKVYLEITNRCNLRCSFCPGTRRPPRTMSPAEFRLLAEKLLLLEGQNTAEAAPAAEPVPDCPAQPEPEEPTAETVGEAEACSSS